MTFDQHCRTPSWVLVCNALQGGSYILFAKQEHNWVLITFDQHCRTQSWVLVCIAWCKRTFLPASVVFFVLIRKPFSSHRGKLAFPLVLVVFRLIFRKLPLLFLHNIQKTRCEESYNTWFRAFSYTCIEMLSQILHSCPNFYNQSYHAHQ